MSTAALAMGAKSAVAELDKKKKTAARSISLFFFVFDDRDRSCKSRRKENRQIGTDDANSAAQP